MVDHQTGGVGTLAVTISSNSVTRGQTILLVADLTNIGPNMTFNQFVRPYINPSVIAENGTEVWAWDLPQSTWPNVTVASGETISQDVNIPTMHFSPGSHISLK